MSGVAVSKAHIIANFASTFPDMNQDGMNTKIIHHDQIELVSAVSAFSYRAK